MWTHHGAQRCFSGVNKQLSESIQTVAETCLGLNASSVMDTSTVPPFPMMPSWINCHDCSLPYHLIFTAVQPARRCGKDTALSFVHILTQSFYLICTKPTADCLLNAVDSYRKTHTHTPCIKAYCWKKKNRITSLEKLQRCVSLQKDKLTTGQVLWSTVIHFCKNTHILTVIYHFT